MKAHRLNIIVFGFFAVVIFAAGITAISCNQGPIFYTIATETIPEPPLIRGAPTNMVVFEREDPNNPGEKVPIMYVASGNLLYWYAKDQNDQKAKWDLEIYSIEQPGEKIIDITATKSYLYALCLDGHGLDTSLWRIGGSDDQWEKVSYGGGEYPLVQSIFADPEKDRLFAGAGKDDKDKATYAILYLDDDTSSNTLKLLEGDTTILSGVVFRGGIYYLSTRGAGIYAQQTDDTVSHLLMAAILLIKTTTVHLWA